MNEYDIIIAGAGLSGLSLACHLVNSPLRECSILLVDSSFKERNDRTWAYWTERPTLFDNAVYHSWDKLRFVGNNFSRSFHLGCYQYQVIRGLDFYRRAKHELSAYPNVTLRCGQVEEIDDGQCEARVTIDGQAVTGNWVFDSTYKPIRCYTGRERYRTLKLHFTGWEIRTPTSVFDPQVATLIDFRTPQNGSVRFFYVLPYSKQHALIEYTIFSKSVLRRHEYSQAMEEYLERILGLDDYQIERRESGCLPVTDRPFPRRLGRRVMAIGTRGGRLKPSTGYAFTRVQEDSASIVRSLHLAGHPFDVPADPRRYQLCDSLLLQVMGEHGEQIESIFGALFKNNPIDRVFRFLDEVASPWEHLRIIPTMPPQLFLDALLQRLVWSDPMRLPAPLSKLVLPEES